MQRGICLPSLYFLLAMWEPDVNGRIPLTCLHKMISGRRILAPHRPDIGRRQMPLFPLLCGQPLPIRQYQIANDGQQRHAASPIFLHDLALVQRGQRGPQGPQGKTGAKGADGRDGSRLTAAKMVGDSVLWVMDDGDTVEMDAPFLGEIRKALSVWEDPDQLYDRIQEMLRERGVPVNVYRGIWDERTSYDVGDLVKVGKRTYLFIDKPAIGQFNDRGLPCSDNNVQAAMRDAAIAKEHRVSKVNSALGRPRRPRSMGGQSMATTTMPSATAPVPQLTRGQAVPLDTGSAFMLGALQDHTDLLACFSVSSPRTYTRSSYQYRLA